ncbi:MAG: hypothetical protein CMO66_01505 [Verrucomicrobiales bacterium]|nr:hypothetical protein [Verrucomicrobiales bacterium]
MIRLKAIVAAMLLWNSMPSAQAFVLMGPANTNEVATFNYTSEMGAPKGINREFKRFFRWNIPSFVYSFDASFVNYFGIEGMDAIHDAFRVMNDFFVNEDYDGVSQMDLAKHGFSGNYSTWWVNTTAQNAQIIDIKSIMLGMLVNQLGIGNPHRWAFSITGTRANITTNRLIFETRLRNYDPITWRETDIINGVKYSYRLVHDAQTNSVGQLPAFNVADMEEFTTDTSGNAWSSVAAITDAFYGDTALYWTDTPSRFNFGVYYDGMNAMGGQFRPRHALTYDDAGGFKYLYATNNYIFEDLAPSIVGIEPAQFLPTHIAPHYANPSGRVSPFFPRRGRAAGILTPTNTITTTFAGFPGLPNVGTGIMGPAMRGGIDKIQFYHQPFDSLLGLNFIPTNFVWKDTFIFQPTNHDTVNISDSSGRVIGTVNNNQQGIQWLSPNPSVADAKFWRQPQTSMKFLTQTVGRNVATPDMIFVCDDLGLSADGVPIGWLRPTNSSSNLSSLNGGFVQVAAATNQIGPGIFTLPAGPMVFQFTRLAEDFEVVWSGEASVVGNQERMRSLWGWIQGPGPKDVITFPIENNEWRMENILVPDVAPPVITMVSDDGGNNPIEAQTLTRTEETLTLIGNEMASVTAIEILNGDLVVQTLLQAQQYVVSNMRLDIPAGTITDASEGTERSIRVWNSVGASEPGPQKFKIETGKPMVSMTDFDNTVFDRAQSLTIRGYGFKSKTTGETQLAHFRIDDSTGAAIDDNGTNNDGVSDGRPRAATFEIISDTMAILPLDAVKQYADGSNRRLRVARKVGTNAQDDANYLSPSTNDMFSAITTKPVITTLTQLEDPANTWTSVTDDGAFRRDRILEINGTGLNTANVIEVVEEDGTSFANPVFIQLPNAAVAVEDNGSRIQMSANAIPYSDADTNSTAKRAFKIYNAVGNTDLNATLMFAVNKQPVIDGIGAFASAGYFNRDKLLGDDINIFGSGLKAISQVIITDDNDTAQDRITIALPSPGITVADNQISIDTSTFQLGSGADTDMNSSRRLIKLTSARDNATSAVAQRFYIGAPPTMGDIGAFNSTGHYRRDFDTLTISGGSGYGHITKLEIVDALGNPIAGVPGIITGPDGTGGTGLNVGNDTSLSVAANATGWVTSTHLLDSVTVESRRVKITTPFGTVTSAANSTEAFTVSATPEVLNTAQATFAGGGYTGDLGGSDDANGTYDKSEGDLVINGKNFSGLTSIAFGQGTGSSFEYLSAGGNFTVSPLAPPQGFSFNAAGTQIIIDDAVIPAGWIGTDGNYSIKLNSVADQNTTTQEIQTQN